MADVVEDKPLGRRRPRILIMNDDGVNSAGLKQLAIALEDHLQADIVVCCTIDNQIHPSFSITIHEQIRAKKMPVWGRNIAVYAVAGFPMNCLKYAYGHVLPSVVHWDSLDLVVAGINKGRNVGTDLLYSGTLSLACAARFANESFLIPTPKALAISLCPPSPQISTSTSTSSSESKSTNQNHEMDWDFSVAVEAAKQITTLALRSQQTPNVVWNVNIPQRPRVRDDAHHSQQGEAVFAWAVTRPALLHYDRASLISLTNVGAKESYTDFMINGPDFSRTAAPGTDVFALHERVISISPIECSPALHTPLHATNNLIELLREDEAHFESFAPCFWNVDVDIRPLGCIVQCLAHWIGQGQREQQRSDSENQMATYTLYLERDIKICARKRDFAERLESEFGWVPKMEKFEQTLTWTQMERLYEVLAVLEGSASRGEGEGAHVQVVTGALVAVSVALSVAMVALLRAKWSLRRQPGPGPHF